MLILIGSRAAAMQMAISRPMKDWDMIGTKREIQHWLLVNNSSVLAKETRHGGVKLFVRHAQLGGIEFEVTENLKSAEILHSMLNADPDRMRAEITNIGGVNVYVPKLPILFCIKFSHIYQPVQWEKNIRDLHELARFRNTWIEKTLDTFISTRRQETKVRTPSLAQSNQRFFGQSDGKVPSVYPHDALHFAVSLYERPVFVDIKADQSRAWCDGNLWSDLPMQKKLDCVREEAWVIALERKIIPSKYKTDANEAYQWALMRICTTLCSGWFREFAMLNWPWLSRHSTNDEFVHRFLDNIDRVLKEDVWREYYEG